VSARISQWTLDVQDVRLMSRFWAAALGYRTEARGDGSAKLHPPRDAGPQALSVWLQASAGPKYGKNRNHPDLSTDGDVDTEAAFCSPGSAHPESRSASTA
jgi:hypothetical protein